MMKYKDSEIVFLILIVNFFLFNWHISVVQVPVDGPGLYTGPVFTAASTGPLFST